MRGNSETPKRLKLRNIILNLAFLLIIFFVFIGALELLLRTTHLFGARISWSQPDPILGWRFTPGSHYWFNKENDHPITTIAATTAIVPLLPCVYYTVIRTLYCYNYPREL